jgi:pSer/pThr/pTyr-binding forkhead associated (FHA) protein
VADPALRFLEYVFLALLYLFFLRVLRAVWVELREPRLVPAVPNPPRTVPPATTNGSHQRRGGPHRLVVVSGDLVDGQVFDLADELTIGRSPGCGVSLPSDGFVSQVHARLFRRGGEYWVEDLGSTNGTLMNGRKLAGAAPLRKGDRVQVGRTALELQK